MNWFPFTYILDNLITNSIHAWLTKDYRSSGMLNALKPIKVVQFIAVANNNSIHDNKGEI